MALNLLAPKERLITVLGGLATSPAVTVITGVPESLPARVSAYITLGPIIPLRGSLGLQKSRVEYLVTFAYRVAGNEGAAEDAILTIVPLFMAALLEERKTRLAGTVVSLGEDNAEGAPVVFSRASSPEYFPLAGQEFRLYPGIVPTIQQEPH
ncbi:MAG TPA: hypothetical protein VNM48_10535 [Chloroflexota bacterium]|nr:hypothetical protein [Chloroflexota bacterium]